MAHFEQSPAPTGSTAADKATPERNVMPAKPFRLMPLVAVLIALAFAASAWVFYQQGEPDATQSAASPPVSAADDAAPRESTQLAASGNESASATTAAQTASSGDPEMVVTAHPSAAQMQASAAKPKLAKASKPAKRTPVVARAPIDRQIALAVRPQPVYPVQALRAREQGTVLVLAQVDVNGHVSDARIVQRSGSSILDRAAPNEVRRWKFEPALHNGRPIVASVEVPVSYRLDQ